MSERRLIDQTEAHQVTAPNGTVYNVKVSNTGEFYTEKVAEGVGNDAVALWKASSYDGTSQFLQDLSGNNHHLRIGSTQPAYVADGALHLPGVAGNYASTPDSASVSITGDIDIRVHAALADWTPALETGLIGKYEATTNKRSYMLRVTTGGSLTIYLSNTGITPIQAISSAPIGFADGSAGWLRATWRQSDGRVQFFTSSDGIMWTQLGADQSIVLASLFDSDDPLRIGVPFNSGENGWLNGRIFYAEVRNGIDGTVVAKFDPSDQADFATSWYSETGEQWMVNSTAGSDTNEPKFLAKESSNYLYLPGVVGNYASVPDANNLDITGDIDIRVKVALDDWTPATTQTLMAKEEATTQRSWRLGVLTNGRPFIMLSADGTTGAVSATATASPTVLDGNAIWIRVSWRASDGRVQFFTSSDGGAWAQLGSDQSIVISSIFSSSSKIEIGSRIGGTAEPLSAKVYRAIIRNVINDQTVLDIDFSKASPSSATFTAETGQTVTINRSSSGRKAVVVDRDLFLFGTDDYMETPDHPDLDFGAGDSFTAVAVFRRFGTGNHTFIAKAPSVLSSGTGWGLARDTSGPYVFTEDGAVLRWDYGAHTLDGENTVFVGVRNKTTGMLVATTNGVSASSSADTDTSTNLNSDLALRIGRLSGSGNLYADMEFIGAGVWRRALTDEEIALLGGEFDV